MRQDGGEWLSSKARSMLNQYTISNQVHSLGDVPDKENNLKEVKMVIDGNAVQTKSLFIRGVDVEVIRRMKVLSVSKNENLSDTLADLVNFYEKFHTQGA